MPCWTRRTQTVDLKVADPRVLADALKAIGFSILHLDAKSGIVQAARLGSSITWQSGKVTITTNVEAVENLVGEIKRSYTKEAFNVAAQKFGYQIRTERGKLVAARRRY